MIRNLIVLPVELQEKFAHNLKTRGPKKDEKGGQTTFFAL